jgi:hypothetical protein
MPSAFHPGGLSVGDAVDGRQGSVACGMKIALGHFDTAMVAAEFPSWDAMPDDFVVGDNALLLLGAFATHLSNESHLKPNGDEYAVTSLVKYFEYVVVSFKERYNKRPGYFKIEPEELTLLKDNMRKLVSARNQTGSCADDVVDVKTAPLFGKTNRGASTMVLLPDPHSVYGKQLVPMSPATDLRFICSQLMASGKKGSHATMLQLCLTRAAVGRGGEVKFLQWPRVWWDPYLGCCLARWFQPKQLKVSLTSFMADYSCMELDCFFNFACFWMMEDGLTRPTTNPYAESTKTVGHSAGFVFQDLHKTTDQNTTRLLSNAIKKHVPAETKDMLSVKSLRIGSSTELASNRLITFDESLARGGWSDGTNRKYYVFMTVAMILPPMKCLAHWPDPLSSCPYPSFDELAEEDQGLILQLILKLYSIDVPEFAAPTQGNRNGGRLRPFMNACTAALLMYYKTIIRDYSVSHPVIVKLIECADRAWPDKSRPDCHELLQRLSSAIQKNFDYKKSLVSHEVQGNEMLERVRAMQTQQGQQLTVACDSLARSRHQNEQLQREISRQGRQLEQLVEAHEKTNLLLYRLLHREVESPSPRPPASATTAPSTSEVSTGGSGIIVCAPSPLVPSPLATTVVARATPVQDANDVFPTLMLHAQMAKAVESGRDQTLGAILSNLYRNKKLVNLKAHQLRDLRPCGDITIPVGRGGYVFKYEAAMDLVDCVWSEEERELAMTCDPSNDEEVKKIFESINVRAINARTWLQGKESSARAKPNYVGIGNSLNQKISKDVDRTDNYRDGLGPWKPSWMKWYKEKMSRKRPADAEEGEKLHIYVARQAAKNKKRKTKR